MLETEPDQIKKTLSELDLITVGVRDFLNLNQAFKFAVDIGIKSATLLLNTPKLGTFFTQWPSDLLTEVAVLDAAITDRTYLLRQKPKVS